ncbi:hypothetical protein CCH79_00006029 [Gambusia affinis]|uniref:Spondin domain-containing protein n=1 Tax=Gambusia affinis TaxID=33528 RepID=A0A315VJA4_GAMAF|nr:hypothetical protein CCH79_00006029 [Gambusia affinis]
MVFVTKEQKHKSLTEQTEVGGSRRSTLRLRGGNDLIVWLRTLRSFIDTQKESTASHNHHFRLWEEGSSASPGVQSFAEVGVTVELMKAAKEARKKRTVGVMYRTAGIPNGIGHSSTEMLMVPRNPLLSLMVKMIPSPDWFVGVDSLNLCEGNRWKQEVTVDLQPYDAGTDSGFTFSSPNFPTSPPENITKITSQMPNHPANSFYYPRLKELPPIASIKITRQRRTPDRQTSISNHILPNSINPQRFSATPLDCEVSLWSSWGLCLGPCSRGGVRHRTRYILLRPANAGSPCPELEEQDECVPHNCIKKRHTGTMLPVYQEECV